MNASFADTNTSFVIIGIFGMLILALAFVAAVFYSQRRKSQHQLELQQMREQQQNLLIEAAIKSEETERHRIAEELHDEVGALLSSTRLHFSSLDTELMSKRDKQVHQRSKELLDESIQKVRTISHNLHSSILKELGLNEAIRHFILALTKDTGIECQFELDENYGLEIAEADISIYRLLQELVNNLLKYAHPKKIEIFSSLTAQNLQLELRHDGNGLDQEEFERLRYSKGGLGLKNIQNRIILLKGSIQFEKGTGDCRVIIQIPTTNK